MTKREARTVNAFLNCIKYGEYTEAYATTLIEDDKRFGWMSEEAKQAIYSSLSAGEDSETTDELTV